MIRVSPFTVSNLNNEFKEELQNLGLVLDQDNGALKFKVSLSLDEENRRGVTYRSKYSPWWTGPVLYDDYDDYDRAIESHHLRSRRLTCGQGLGQ